MEKRLLFLYLIIAELGLKEELQKFYLDLSSRKKLQKYLYIFQEILYKQSFQYSYNLYIYGPYSPSLTKDLIDLYSEKIEYERAASQYKLSGEIISNIKKEIDLLAQRGEIDVVNWLELICTFHYLYTKTYLRDSDRETKWKEYISKNKPHLVPFIDRVPQALPTL